MDWVPVVVVGRALGAGLFPSSCPVLATVSVEPAFWSCSDLLPVSGPPFPFSHAVEPDPCGLRCPRANRIWLVQTLSSIELLFTRGRAGVPLLLRIPIPFSALRPFSEWLCTAGDSP